MRRFLARRLFHGAVVIFIAASLSFFIIHLAPGDPFSSVFDDATSDPGVIAARKREFGLDRRSFRLLGRLRSFGPPYQRSAGMLANDMQLSSGAMTNRLDRMEKAGLIRRLDDPNDRRGTLVEPTDAGHAAWDQAVGTQARREAMIAAVLTEKEREQLHGLLRKIMRAFPDKDHGLKLGASDATEDPSAPHRSNDRRTLGGASIPSATAGPRGGGDLHRCLVVVFPHPPRPR